MSAPPTERHASFLEAAKSIFWAFFGVRRRHHGEQDALKLTPLQIVAAGILGGAVFVLVLVLVVRVIVTSHGAAN
ncbi:MAG: DUF2970 domain-containing protein [Betaproteobacteria bacterium]|nr:DUF2970 domain-containing protein [Betaproteobacteria bacterium]